MRAAIYARVSTQRQEQEETIESQLAAIKERIFKDDATINDTYIYKDEGYSGSLIERPSLDRLREDCKRDLFDVIYVFDYGRLSRELTDLMIVKDDLERSNNRVISLFERITGDQATDRLLLQIMGAVHEYEKKKIAQRFHNGKMQKAKRGQIVGYNAPYGYRYNKDSGKFDIYEPEAIVVRQIFDWVAINRCTSYSIIKKLHDLGIKPQKNRSEYWTKGPIDRILKNETYIGKHHYNKSESVVARYRLTNSYRRQMKTGRKIRDRNEWIEHKVPAIVSLSTFEKVQSNLKLNIIFKPGNKKYDYLLTGLIFCSCGSRRNGDGPDNKKYYRCISRHKYFDLINRCDVGGINVSVLDSLVWDNTRKILTNKKIIKQYAEKWIQQNSSATNSNDTKIRDLNAKLAKLNNEESRYVDAYGKGIMPIDLFEAKLKELEPIKSTLKNNLLNISQNRGKVDNINIEELVKKAIQKIGDLAFDQKKFIVEKIIDKIIANPKEVTIWGSIPVQALLATPDGKVKYEPINRDCRLT